MTKKYIVENERFFDIEVYKNFFCCGILTNDFFEFHYLLENDENEVEIFRALDEIGLKYKSYNLKINAQVLKDHFRIQKPNDGKGGLLNNLLDIKEKIIEQRKDWYFSFNGLGYDLLMLDFLISKIVNGKCTTTPSTLRKKSDEIINNKRVYFDSYPYEKYGNNVDIACLNDKLKVDGKLVVGLKTLVGILGGKILDSESNKTGISKSIFDDTLYNYNDIKELRDIVYKNSMLETAFKNRLELLNSFESLDKNKITVNKTTAKFVENIIAPIKPIDDAPILDFIFPAKHIAEKENVDQFDVLEYFKEWYYKNVYLQVSKHNPKVAKEHLIKFLSIYSMYANMRGKNWNTSRRHFNKYKIPSYDTKERSALTKLYSTHLPFIDKYGKLSSTYVKFSIGGIHGAEINQKLLDYHKSLIRECRIKYKYISKIPKGSLPGTLMNMLKAQSRTSYKNVPQKLLHEIPEFYKLTSPCDLIIHEDDFSPFVINKDGKEELHDDYKYTSVANTVHQDFDGYYPKLLILLGVFFDGVGTDYYEAVYNNRIKLKKLLKELTGKEYELINLKQDGLKLVCNSASGSADGTIDTKIRVNNNTVKMRLIGQFCTYIIGQALALEGAHIPSTNTDGIYVSNIDIETNKKIIARELEKLLVTITPEEMLLISKDTNTRIEVVNGKVENAKGGGLTYHKGPSILTRGKQPTIIDRLTRDYLITDDAPNKLFNRELAFEILENYKNSVDSLTFLKNIAWIMRSTSGSIFIDSEGEVHKGTIRTFLTNNGRTIKKFKTSKGMPSVNTDLYLERLSDDDIFGEPNAVHEVYKHNLQDLFTDSITTKVYKTVCEVGVPNKDRKCDKIPMLKQEKISNVDEDMRLTIHNDSLSDMSEEERLELIDSLVYDHYIDLVENNFKSWYNRTE